MSSKPKEIFVPTKTGIDYFKEIFEDTRDQLQSLIDYLTEHHLFEFRLLQRAARAEIFNKSEMNHPKALIFFLDVVHNRPDSGQKSDFAHRVYEIFEDLFVPVEPVG
ncbi:MAG: hypothetical protein ABIH35_01975 [Patescibacteria group bacterium]